MRLIDADALVDVLGDPKLMLTLMLSQKAAERNDEWGMLLRRMDVLRCVLKAPIIDAVPVVHARWVNEENGYRDCSECGCEHPIRDARGYLVDDSYCPNCGAKMDGDVLYGTAE